MTFPAPVLEHFNAGCFAVSISGESMYSVALDEAHEMEINLKTKKAINSFSLSSLAALTHSAHTELKLYNFKSKLEIEKD